jgi:hypothetical protein
MNTMQIQLQLQLYKLILIKQLVYYTLNSNINEIRNVMN